MAKQKTNPPANTESPKSDADASTQQILHGSDTLPALIDIGEGREQLQLGDVVARAHQESGMSVEAWNALPAIERDEKLIAVIEALRADADQDSKAPDTGHADSQAGEQAGTQDAAPGGENPAGAVNNGADEPEGGWCYPILTPSLFKNVVVKEGFIQLTRAEAMPYIAAGVLGDDPCYPPGQEPAE